MPLIEIENELLLEFDAFPLSFTAQERLSRNPEYRLEFQASDADISLVALLGEVIKVKIELPDSAGYRTFCTYVVAGNDEGQRQNQFIYRLELSTWLWFLKQNRNCRIFQDLNIISIIEQVFTRYSVADYRIDITAHYPLREYCVQFAETDFDFINRLMEDEGVWYYIEHSDEKHTLVITDRQPFSPLEGEYAELSFLPDSEEMRAIREGVQRIQRSQRIHASEVVLRDFDFLNPRSSLQTHIEETRQHLQGVPLEWYDYAAGYTDAQHGENIARLRLEAIRSNGQLLSGESNAMGLLVGRQFSLVQHPDTHRNRAFKLIACDYRFVQDGPDSGSYGRNVACHFIALNGDTVYRPLCSTPRPQVPGIQSATVVGARESEVHTDKFARIRVHFHWDRYKTTEEDSSCWIRVVQAWAGKGWGVLAMPRVGQEVLVNYVDGDLDRPMVTGIVYNGENPPPYRLPEHINYSGFVSRSLRFGQPQNGSQLTFDDKRGNERVMMHAERDLQITVERNASASVGQDKYKRVKRTATDWVSNHVSYTDVSFSLTGVAVSAVGVGVYATGVNTSLTGLNTSLTLLNNGFTGINTTFTGINTSFIGVNTTFAGLASEALGIFTSFKGNGNFFTGCSNSVTGSNYSITGFNSATTGKNISMTGVNTSMTGENTSFTGVSFSSVGSSTSKTGISISTTGSSTSVVGSIVAAVGSIISTTGSIVSATGSNVSTTGSSVSATGSSVSTTGCSISHTGNSISKTCHSIDIKGVGISYTDMQYSDVGIDLKTVCMQIKN